MSRSKTKILFLHPIQFVHWAYCLTQLQPFTSHWFLLLAEGVFSFLNENKRGVFDQPPWYPGILFSMALEICGSVDRGRAAGGLMRPSWHGAHRQADAHEPRCGTHISVSFVGCFAKGKQMAIPGLPGGFCSSTRETHLFPLNKRTPVCGTLVFVSSWPPAGMNDPRWGPLMVVADLVSWLANQQQSALSPCWLASCLT